MCTWFYAEKSMLLPIITKAQQLPLADTEMIMEKAKNSPEPKPEFMQV